MATTSGGDSGARLAVFAIQAGPRIGEEFPIRLPRVSIGSGAENDVVVVDDSVSTRHALLEFDHGGWRITDLESTNGTFVEGVRLAPNVPTPIPFGSSLRLGGLRLHFRPVLGADPEAARAAYAPPPPPPTLAERNAGFRVPVWLALVVLLIAIAVAVGIFSWMHSGTEPGTLQTPVEQPAVEAPPQLDLEPIAPAVLDTLPPDTLAPRDTVLTDTVPAGDSPASSPL